MCNVPVAHAMTDNYDGQTGVLVQLFNLFFDLREVLVTCFEGWKRQSPVILRLPKFSTSVIV